MEYIVTDFKEWEPVSEAYGPGRTKQTAGLGQRVVAIPIDEENFKIKIIRDLDVIGKDGKVIVSAMNGVVKWLREQHKWPKWYKGLMDLRKNFLLYSVKKDTKKVQILTITIVSRSEEYKIPEDQNYVEKKELSSLVANNADIDNILNSNNNAEGGKDDDKHELAATVIDDPVPLTKINSIASDSALFKLIKKVYIKFLDVPQISSLDFMPLVKAELKAGKLGVNAMKMLNGIIAGFDIRDEYKDLEDKITFDVVDRLIQIAGKDALNEAIEDKAFKDFNVQAFKKKVQPEGKPKEEVEDKLREKKPAKPEVKKESNAIHIPKGGMKKGVVPSGDENLKKIQNLIISTFDTKLANSPLFIKFKGYGADGKYGPTTEKLVAALKAGYGMKDKTGTLITKPFLDNLVNVNINESFISLDYSLFEKFDMNAYNNVARHYGQNYGRTATKKKTVAKKQVVKAKEPNKESVAEPEKKKEKRGSTSLPGQSLAGPKM